MHENAPMSAKNALTGSQVSEMASFSTTRVGILVIRRSLSDCLTTKKMDSVPARRQAQSPFRMFPTVCFVEACQGLITSSASITDGCYSEAKQRTSAAYGIQKDPTPLA